MAWTEVWLYNTNVLIKLTDSFYLLRHRTKKIIFNWLVHITHSLLVLMQSIYIYIYLLKVNLFSESIKGKTPIMTSKFILSGELCWNFLSIQSDFKSCYLRWSSLTDCPIRTSDKLNIFPSNRTWWQMIQSVLPWLDHYPSFSGFPKDVITPRQQEAL